MRCPACEIELTEGANFCHGCGTKLPGPAICTSCQTELPAEATFCTGCGKGISINDSDVIGHCAVSGTPIRTEDDHIHCSSCDQPCLRLYAFGNHPLCLRCAQKSDMKQTLQPAPNTTQPTPLIETQWFNNNKYASAHEALFLAAEKHVQWIDTHLIERNKFLTSLAYLNTVSGRKRREEAFNGLYKEAMRLPSPTDQANAIKNVATIHWDTQPETFDSSTPVRLLEAIRNNLEKDSDRTAIWILIVQFEMLLHTEITSDVNLLIEIHPKDLGSAYVKGLVSAGKIQEAKNFIQNRPKDEHNLLWHYFSTQCSKESRWEEALAAAQRPGILGSHSLTTLMCNLSKSDTPENAEAIRTRFKDKKHTYYDSSYLDLAVGFAKTGNTSKAMQYVNLYSAEEKDIRPYSAWARTHIIIAVELSKQGMTTQGANHIRSLELLSDIQKEAMLNEAAARLIDIDEKELAEVFYSETSNEIAINYEIAQIGAEIRCGETEQAEKQFLDSLETSRWTQSQSQCLSWWSYNKALKYIETAHVKQPERIKSFLEALDQAADARLIIPYAIHTLSEMLGIQQSSN
jgi:hypothetical protein